MNKRMTRLAAALTVLMFVSAASVQAGAIPGMSQNHHAEGKSAGKSQPQPPKPQPQPPKPQPKPQQTQKSDPLSSNVIGTLRPSNPTQNAVIGTLRPSNPTQNAVIGTLKPSNPTQNAVIGTLKPSNPTQNAAIGTLRTPNSLSDVIGSLNSFDVSSKGGDVIGDIPSVDSLVPQAQNAVKQIEPMMPQIQQQAQQAARQIQNDPAIQQLVQDNPQLNEPIIILPRSVRAGNTGSGSSSGRRRSQHAYGDGYSGGNGQGPLIYNP